MSKPLLKDPSKSYIARPGKNGVEYFTDDEDIEPRVIYGVYKEYESKMTDTEKQHVEETYLKK